MSASDRDILNKVRQWLRYGDEDLLLARHGLTLKSSAPYRLISYHAQQCAEKHLKVYLVFRSIDFPFTHNLGRLIELAQEDRSWPDALLEAETLTPYAITARTHRLPLNSRDLYSSSSLFLESTSNIKLQASNFKPPITPSPTPISLATP